MLGNIFAILENIYKYEALKFGDSIIYYEHNVVVFVSRKVSSAHPSKLHSGMVNCFPIS